MFFVNASFCQTKSLNSIRYTSSITIYIHIFLYNYHIYYGINSNYLFRNVRLRKPQ